MAKNKRIIVSVTNDLYTDQRVHKVCMFLLSQGYEVLLVGRKRKTSVDLPPRGYTTKRMRLLFDKGALFYAEFNFRLFLFLIFRRANILLANDLDTLLANYCASKFKPIVELVYDSHEYFTEVPELEGRRAKKVWEGIEAYIFPRLKKIYTVNQSIADLYAAKYNKEILVVRNISPLWKPETILNKEELGLPTDKKIIIIQGSGINVDRGAEEAVEAMKFIENAVLIIVGDGDVVPTLKTTVQQNKLEHKVLFFAKQPYQLMMNYTYHASIGLTLDKDTNLNYKYSLPNKLFDYIHTSTAIVCTNLVEIRRIVDEYKVGEVIEDFTVENLATCINQLLNDEARLSTYISNCENAKINENWEKETEVLQPIYPKIEVIK